MLNLLLTYKLKCLIKQQKVTHHWCKVGDSSWSHYDDCKISNYWNIFITEFPKIIWLKFLTNHFQLLVSEDSKFGSNTITRNFFKVVMIMYALMYCISLVSAPSTISSNFNPHNILTIWHSWNWIHFLKWSSSNLSHAITDSMKCCALINVIVDMSMKVKFPKYTSWKGLNFPSFSLISFSTSVSPMKTPQIVLSLPV